MTLSLTLFWPKGPEDGDLMKAPGICNLNAKFIIMLQFLFLSSQERIDILCLLGAAGYIWVGRTI